MSQSAYIKLVKGASVASMTLDEVKEQLEHYQMQTSNTGQQLDWDYGEAAFPYTIETKPEGEGKWFYLKGKNDLYKYIVIGIDKQGEGEEEIHVIQIVLPDDCTHGDKAKANELCRFLARRLQAELQMFNGRTMYFNPRK